MAACDNQDTQPEPSTSNEYIGSASMEADDTIIMQVIVEDGQGGRGDLVEYLSPSDPEYEEILDHLDGLGVGESKFIPALPNP